MPDQSIGLVRRDDHGPVSVLTLNRPDRRNALSRAMVDQLSTALEEVARTHGTRVLVLTGSGPTFCAGMDLKEPAERGDNPRAVEPAAIRDMEGLAELVSRLHGLPIPTIAALNGDALGGGAGLAVTCDLVIADEAARIGFPEVRRGLVPAVIIHDVVRAAGERRARQLLLTGQAIDAATAERWGLVTEVTPTGATLDRALILARELVGSAPLAVAATKRLIDEATARPADLRGAAAISAAVKVSDEAIEGMSSFAQKRPPRWAGGAED